MLTVFSMIHQFQCNTYLLKVIVAPRKHPRSLVRDTAYYKPFMTPVRKRFLPKKLSFLAETHLGIHIQKNNCTFNINYGEHALEMEEHDRGHSSIEDAAAALMLYKTVSAKWEERLGHPLNERRSKWV